MKTRFALIVALCLALVAVAGAASPSRSGAAPDAAATPGPQTPTPQAAWDLRWMVTTPRLEAPKPPRRTAALEALGASLYHARCASCHGDSGDGKGPMAVRLNVPPTNFAAGVYKLRSTPTGSIPTDGDLFTTITRGVHGTPMLPWSDLREEERWALVFHLKSLSVRFHEERPTRPVAVPKPPAEDEELRAKGQRLYATLQCVACHGEKGMANGSRAGLYRGPTGQSDVRIRDFSRGRFIRGTEMQDIYLTLRVGLEGTPMASYDALSDGEIWALAAYVRSLIRERPILDLAPAGHSIN
jgi:cytochrome c oxidase cbb3-type subunit 2